jgi:hypothetical protein
MTRQRERPPAGGPTPRLRNRTSLHRRSVTEEEFCPIDGWPFAGKSVRSCIAFGHPEPRRHLRVREADGRIGWLPVPDAVEGGR